jgi:hypothetical protein
MILRGIARVVLGTAWFCLFCALVALSLFTDWVMTFIPRIKDKSRYYDPR